MMSRYSTWFITLLSLGIVGCGASPPDEQQDICEIFEQYPKWYESAKDMQKRWGTPIPLAMAFVKQESGFIHDAKPPKKYVLGVLPWGRVSSAYGYAQVLDGTWDDFQDATDLGGKRTDFADALQFIGWYTAGSKKELSIPYSNVRHHYLAYHEGQHGYKKKRYNKKKWLLTISNNVASQAATYEKQLRRCQAKLNQKDKKWLGIF